MRTIIPIEVIKYIFTSKEYYMSDNKREQTINKNVKPYYIDILYKIGFNGDYAFNEKDIIVFSGYRGAEIYYKHNINEMQFRIRLKMSNSNYGWWKEDNISLDIYAYNEKNHKEDKIKMTYSDIVNRDVIYEIKEFISKHLHEKDELTKSDLSHNDLIIGIQKGEKVENIGIIGTSEEGKKVYIDLERPHVISILGKPGCGKGYFIGVIAEMLLSKGENSLFTNNIPVTAIIF